MITTLMKQKRGLDRFSKMPWAPKNSPVQRKNNSIPEINLINRETFKHNFHDLIRSWLIKLECLKTGNIGLTSQASKRQQEYVYYSLKIEEKETTRNLN